VRVLIFPNPGAPTDTILANVVNLGMATDTFDLSVVGPLATAASLGSASVTLDANTQQDIPVTFKPLTFVKPGPVVLQVSAISRGNAVARDIGRSTISVPGVAGIATTLTPGDAKLGAPGPVNLILQADSTGNTNDLYTATITKITGPLTVSLQQNGQALAAIPAFAIPGNGSAQIPVMAQLTANGTGTVTITVTSIANPAITSSATATISTGAATVLPPVANAGPAATVPVNRSAPLDGTASSDPNAPPLALTYAWAVTSAPAGSKVTTATVRFANAARAAFTPDVAGAYTFQLTVTNSASLSSSASVTITAQDFPPVAKAGRGQNIKTGNYALLNGRDSYDPDGMPIAFAWTLVSAPAGSAAILYNAQTPRPYLKADVDGAYKLQLIVRDAAASSTPDFVTVTSYTGTVAPNANAGPDQNVKVKTTVTLNGLGSFDGNAPPLPLTYNWAFGQVPAGSALLNANIGSATTSSPQFTPDVPGDYVLSLQVSNGTLSSVATTTIHAFSGNVPPNASAGADQYVSLGGTATLDGSKSVDPDNSPQPLTYAWMPDSFAPGSAASIGSSAAATAQITPDKPGFYVVRLETSDGLDSGFADTLVQASVACDVDAIGVINALDISLITSALGMTALPNDPRAPTGGATIGSADVAACQAKIVSGLPALSSAPNQLTFTTPLNGPAPAAMNLTVKSSGALIAFTVSADQPWIVVNTASGDTGANNVIGIGVNPAGLTAPSYTGNVILTSSGASNSPLSIPVTLTITPLTGVTITTNPAGLAFTINGTTFTSTQTLNLAAGTLVTIGAPATQGTGTRYRFASWSDGGSQIHQITIGSSAVTYTASFTTEYLVTTGVTPAAGGLVAVTPVSPTSDGYYAAGTPLTVAATAGAGFVFLNYTGDATGNTPSLNLTADSPKNITANFGALSGITINTNPANLNFSVNGTTYTSAQTLSLAPGTIVTLAAPTTQGTGGTRYRFSNWSDGGPQMHTITVPAGAATYTANFTTEFLVTAAASPSVGGSVALTPPSPTSDGFYAAGTNISVMATPNTGFVFANYSGDLT
ncbi:MAG: hypothetical protein M3Z36_14175, partial [Acidobacteriota bacterium]|nr:hypothetical protein [Acidobacteriota bacterium]